MFTKSTTPPKKGNIYKIFLNYESLIQKSRKIDDRYPNN